jgi:hypothetical protein
MIISIELLDEVVDELVTACAYRSRLDPVLLETPLSGVTVEQAQAALQAFVTGYAPAVIAEHRNKVATHVVEQQTIEMFPCW